MVSFSLPPLTLEIADGDIAAETTDAVVNAANNAFWKPSTSLRLVRVLLFGQAAYRVFAEVAADLLGPPLDGPPDCPVSG
jgi:hypothetical protein